MSESFAPRGPRPGMSGLIDRVGAATEWSVGVGTDLAGVVPRMGATLIRQALGRIEGHHVVDVHALGGLPGSIRGGAELVLDEALLLAIKAGFVPHSPRDLTRIGDELDTALQVYRRHGWDLEPATFHHRPPRAQEVRLHTRHQSGLRYEHLSFPSAYQPHPDLPGRERWLGYRPNGTVHAWVLRHREPRPWLLCLHGALMGSPRVDFVGFRAGWLHRDLGLNLAMMVMPRHGARRGGPPLPLVFPGDDPLDNVNGFAQAVSDARQVAAWVRDEGGERVGVYGISLGGYAAALLASLDSGYAALIAGIPPADMAAMFDRHLPARLRGRPEYATFVARVDELQRVVSPLTYPPHLARRRRFIYAGTSDHLVDSYQQARALWSHWDRPRIQWFPGSHVGFLWSPAVQAFVREALVETELVPEDVAAPRGKGG